MKLNVSIGHIQFQNPVTIASGTFGYISKYAKSADIQKLGAFIPKTITLAAREGNPSPRIVETASGMINAIGIENDGLDHFLAHKLPDLAKLKIPLIVSVSAYQHNDFETLVTRLSQEESVSLIELNLSCPNLKHARLIAQDPAATQEVVAALKKISAKPLIAKLSPNVTDIAAVAFAAQEAGADAVSLVNTFSAMAVDVHRRRPVLGNVTGGLSGPAIKPIALKMVYDVKKRVTIPIIAMGGIMTAEDALEFLIVGATMVAVGTANFVDPQTPLRVLQGIKAYMKQHRVSDIHDIIGSLRTS
ncbi:MAG TPA: dihydroorotate dehydrogenase [Candidatus Omnitrophota bacterium]|nr:dihydroorotate dehydrogenase [Candidatus Omnitrophota bacterium]